MGGAAGNYEYIPMTEEEEALHRNERNDISRPIVIPTMLLFHKKLQGTTNFFYE